MVSTAAASNCAQKRTAKTTGENLYALSRLAVKTTFLQTRFVFIYSIQVHIFPGNGIMERFQVGKDGGMR